MIKYEVNIACHNLYNDMGQAVYWKAVVEGRLIEPNYISVVGRNDIPFIKPMKGYITTKILVNQSILTIMAGCSKC